MRSAQYYPVYVENSARQTTVEFYYTPVGYLRPAGDNGKYWFWSSSLQPDHRVEGYVYVLNGDSGVFDYGTRSIDYGFNAIRCLQ